MITTVNASLYPSTFFLVTRILNIFLKTFRGVFFNQDLAINIAGLHKCLLCF